jgi:hypothetical protein
MGFEDPFMYSIVNGPYIQPLYVPLLVTHAGIHMYVHNACTHTAGLRLPASSRYMGVEIPDSLIESGGPNQTQTGLILLLSFPSLHLSL